MKPNNVVNLNRHHVQSQKNILTSSVIEYKLSNSMITSQKLSSLNKFLAGYCGCADVEVLQHDACGQDRKKYVTIGTSVLFTALLASCSGGFALFTAFKSIELAAGFGILWGAIILNIDRAMLVNMTAKKASDDTFGKKFMKAVPRLILSVAIGMVISTPLTLKVFETEINAKLTDNYIKTEEVKIEDRKNADKKITVKADEIEAEIKELKKRRAAEDDKLTNETGGKRASGLQGDGPMAKSIQKTIDNIDKQIGQKEAEKTKELENIAPRLAKIDKDFKSESKIRENSNGFLDRLNAREELIEDKTKPAAGMAIHGLEFLLIAIEVAPLLIKLMAQRGNYEEILSQQQADRLLVSKDRQMHRREIQAKEEAIEYQSHLIDSQKKLLSIQANGDPVKFAEYVNLIKHQLSKLDLNAKLVEKLMESMSKENINEQSFDTAIKAYNSNLDPGEIAAYQQLFNQMKGLDRNLLAQIVNNYNYKSQTKAA